ncbi:hypothetical protein D3C76_1593560 [compost metagenome]
MPAADRSFGLGFGAVNRLDPVAGLKPGFWADGAAVKAADHPMSAVILLQIDAD